MAFTIDGWDALSAGVSFQVATWYTYKNLNDTIATMKGSGYFNNRINLLNVSDVIHIQGSDDYDLLNVTSVTTNVTVEDYVNTTSLISKLSNSLDATVVANGAFQNATAYIPVIHQINTIGGQGGNFDITVTHKIDVLDAWVVQHAQGGTGDILQLYDGQNAISGTIDLSGQATKISRPILWNHSFIEISAGGILRATQSIGASGTLPASSVYIIAKRKA